LLAAVRIKINDMTKLNSQQAIRLLKKEKGNYLKHYFSGGSIYNDEGDDIGDVSQKVIDNLVAKGKIKKQIRYLIKTLNPFA
jgi:hypothetical protein